MSDLFDIADTDLEPCDCGSTVVITWSERVGRTTYEVTDECGGCGNVLATTTEEAT